MRASVVVLLCCGIACKKDKPVTLPPEPIPAPAAVSPASNALPVGPLRRAGFVSYAIYFAKMTPSSSATFERLVKKTRFTVVKQFGPSVLPSVYGFSPGIAEVPPPDEERLRLFGRGLTPVQQTAAANSKDVFVLAFNYPSEAIPAVLKEADALTGSFALETGGLIFDAETRELFAPEAFATMRQAAWKDQKPIVSRHCTIHTYRDGNGYRAVSLGMSKLGLPDLCVNQIPGDRFAQIGALMELAMQSIHDRPELQVSNELQIMDLRVPAGTGTPTDGDNPNRLIELRPSGALLDGLATVHQVGLARDNDEELQEASRRARAQLPRVKAVLSKDLAAGAVLQVKAPFEHPEGREFMWVNVHRWDGQRITGVLDNSPRFVKSLVAGAVVTVDEADVFDWVRIFPDGGTEGNETTRIIMGDETH